MLHYTPRNGAQPSVNWAIVLVLEHRCSNGIGFAGSQDVGATPSRSPVTSADRSEQTNKTQQ